MRGRQHACRTDRALHRELRMGARGTSPLIGSPWAALVAEGVILNKDGSFQLWPRLAWVASDNDHLARSREPGSRRTEFARELFAPIGRDYDRVASVLSFGQDPRWRCFLVSRIEAGPGDRVLTSPLSFVASANSCLFERARPVFADIDPLTLNLDDPRFAEATMVLFPVFIAREIDRVTEALGDGPGDPRDAQLRGRRRSR